MKELTLIRDKMLDTHTEGRLLMGDKELAKTLELPWRGNAVNTSCIPVGEYQGASITRSNGDTVYSLFDTPSRKGIQIAVGNTTNDTRGNILVGDSFSVMNGLPAVTQSRRTLQEVIKTVGRSIALKVCEADTAEDGDIVCKNNSFVDPDNSPKEVYHQNNKVWVVPKGCGISINPNLMRRGIEVLHPVTMLKVKKLLDACAEEGLRVLILDTLRLVEEQDRLYWQSRTNPPTGPRVSNSPGGRSWHNWMLAVDFCQNIRGQEYADTKFFHRVGAIGKSAGLFWGGDFTTWKDLPHLEDRETAGVSTVQGLIDKYGTPDNFKETWK